MDAMWNQAKFHDAISCQISRSFKCLWLKMQ